MDRLKSLYSLEKEDKRSKFAAVFALSESRHASSFYLCLCSNFQPSGMKTEHSKSLINFH